MSVATTAKVNGKTIYIGANMDGVSNALKGIEERAKVSKNELKTLEKALKLDPTNVELLSEKEKTLAESIKTAKERLEQLKNVSEKVKSEYENGEIDRGKYLKFKSTVAESEAELKKLNKQAEENKSAIQKATSTIVEDAEQTKNLTTENKKASDSIKDVSQKSDKLETQSKETSKEIKVLSSNTHTSKLNFDLLSKSIAVTKTAMGGLATAMKTAVQISTALLAGVGAIATASASVGKSFDTATSQLASTMGKTVGEISELTAKAKEMGATTAFSATQATEGLNILAMSGLNAKEQISTIEPVLNLASAGTLSLAEASSFTTGAVKGFKDEMKNASYYTDLMAKGATLANTDVRGLGSALSYVSATANSYGQKADKVTLSLLKLAEQNITGETAATMLNRAMADLYTPTDNAKKALDELGIACYDADGKTREFNTVVAELNTKLSTMSDEQANAYKNTIFTTNGLNAFNKMCATSSEKSEEFEKALSNASGSAKKQAETMLDNLEGDLTLFKSATEGFGLTIYENMRDPLRNIVQSATGYMGELDEVFKFKGVKGAVKRGGEIFGEIATHITEQAPKMIDAGISFLNAFTTSVIRNAPQIISAGEEIIRNIVNSISNPNRLTILSGGASRIIKQLSESMVRLAPDVAKAGVRIVTEIGKAIIRNAPVIAKAGMKIVDTLATTLTNALPTKIGKPLQNTFRTIANSFKSGGLNKLIKTSVNILKEFGKIALNIATKVLPPLANAIDFLGENADKIIPLLTGVYLAIKSYQILTTATALVNTFKVAMMGLNATISANPLGLFIGAVGAVIGIAGSFMLANNDMAESVDTLSEHTDKFAERADGAFQAMNDFKDGISSANGILENFDVSNIISEEDRQKLDTEMSEVQKRINEIAGSKSDERKKFTEAEIKELDDLFKKEQELAQQQLEKQKQYQTAVHNLAESLAKNTTMGADEYEAEAQRYLKSAEETRNQVISLAEQQKINTLAEKRQLMQENSAYDEEWYQKEVDEADKRYNQAKDSANKQYSDTSKIIADGYKKRADALNKYQEQQAKDNIAYQKEEERHNQALHDLEQDWNSRRSRLKNKYRDDVSVYYAEYGKEEKKYQKRIEDENQKHSDILSQNYEDLSGAFTDEAQKQAGVWIAMLSDVELYGGKINKKDKQFVDGFLDELYRLPPESKEIMKDTVAGMIEGMKEDEPGLFAKVGEMTDGMINKMRRMLGIASPSKVMRKMFGYVGQGAVLGLTDSENSVIQSAEKFSRGFIRAVNPADTFSGISAVSGGLNRFGTSSTNSTVNNSTDKSITVNVHIDSVSGSSNADIYGMADRIEEVIVQKINRRGRAFISG